MSEEEKIIYDEHGFHYYHEAKMVPITFDRIDKLLQFVTDYIRIRDRIIKKYEAEGKDTTNLVADRDYALYVLGLGEKPKRYGKVIL